MLHMQLVQHSMIFPVLFYLNLHFSLLIRVIQNPSIITIFTIHIPKIHSFTFWNCFRCAYCFPAFLSIPPGRLPRQELFSYYSTNLV